MGALLLWLHALAALLFGALALWAWRTDLAGLPRRPLAFALAATALWALAIAGIGSTDVASWFAETLRNLAWLGFMLVLHRRDAQTRPPIALGTVYGVVALVQIGALGLTLIAYADPEPIVAAQTANAAVLLRMLVAVAALVLVQALWSALSPAAGGPLRSLVLALAGIWCAELGLYTIAYLAAEWRIEPLVLRGLAYLAIALAIGTALALATSAIATVGGPNARILQTAFVLGSTAAILTLVANSWLRAWLKVKLAKHLFRHRYDYRTEWMRFTETLGNPQGGAALDERIVKAIADLTESPAGVLLVPDAGGLGVGASWNWDRTTLPIASDMALGEHLQATGRIIELDAVRRSEDHRDASVVPQWMLDLPEAWVIVPLPHLAELAGAILLARPPLDRALDWEDFDLLKVAGRQVASYLAEARAQEALAEAQRFDEFNRRFAFILHDIKNLVSQLTLTARNAERHADKPEFRADMVATLQSSAERMNGLLARLSQHHRGRSEAPHAIEIVALVERVASQRRGQHPVVTSGVRSAIAHADPASLEQLLGHLVQNAIDASPANEPVTLAVLADGERVAIDVIDLGTGMSPGFIRDKLFKPFVSSKEGGFGIGAFEARQLAHAMEGRIEVTSREGKGTRFRVILRAAHPADLGMGRAA